MTTRTYRRTPRRRRGTNFWDFLIFIITFGAHVARERRASKQASRGKPGLGSRTPKRIDRPEQPPKAPIYGKFDPDEDPIDAEVVDDVDDADVEVVDDDGAVDGEAEWESQGSLGSGSGDE